MDLIEKGISFPEERRRLLDMVQKVPRSHQVSRGNFGFAIWSLENCESSSKWVPTSNEGGVGQQKERDGLPLSSAMSKIQWFSYTFCPYDY